MTLAALPEYDFIPAPLWLITVLHLLTLTLHFVAMNFMVGGIVTVLFGRIENRWQNSVVQKFIKLFPTVMAVTVTLGVAPLLFAQLTYGGPLYSAAIVSAWFWILIPIVVIVLYYFLYGSALAKAGSPKVGLWLGIALVGLLYVSVVYSSVFSMAERPALQASVYAGNQSGLAINPHVGEWAFRWLHMLTGALTVGAFLFAWLGQGDEPGFRAGRTFFFLGLALATVTGFLYLLTLGDALKPFMQSTGIWFLTLGIVLSAVALWLFVKRRLLASALALFLSLGTMVITRHVLRLVVLPYGQRPMEIYEGKVQPQWDVFALFLVCFLIALALVAWMLRVFLRAKPA